MTRSTNSDVGTFLISGFSDPLGSGDLINGDASSDDWFTALSTAPNDTVTADIEVNHLFSGVWNVDPEFWSLWRRNWLVIASWMLGMEPKVVLSVYTPSNVVLGGTDLLKMSIDLNPFASSG